MKQYTHTHIQTYRQTRMRSYSVVAIAKIRPKLLSPLITKVTKLPGIRLLFTIWGRKNAKMPLHPQQPNHKKSP